MVWEKYYARNLPEKILPGSICLSGSIYKIQHYFIPGTFSHGVLYLGTGLKDLLTDFFSNLETMILFHDYLNPSKVTIQQYLDSFDNTTEYFLTMAPGPDRFVPREVYEKRYDIFMILELDYFKDEYKDAKVMEMVSRYSLISLFKYYSIFLGKEYSHKKSYCFKNIWDCYSYVFSALGYNFEMEFEQLYFWEFKLGEFLFAKNMILNKSLKIKKIILKNRELRFHQGRIKF